MCGMRGKRRIYAGLRHAINVRVACAEVLLAKGSERVALHPAVG